MTRIECQPPRAVAERSGFRRESTILERPLRVSSLSGGEHGRRQKSGAAARANRTGLSGQGRRTEKLEAREAGRIRQHSGAHTAQSAGEAKKERLARLNVW